jgi:hypothetical protein
VLLGKKNQQPAKQIPRQATTTYFPSSGSIYQSNPGSEKLSRIAHQPQDRSERGIQAQVGQSE